MLTKAVAPSKKSTARHFRALSCQEPSFPSRDFLSRDLLSSTSTLRCHQNRYLHGLRVIVVDQLQTYATFLSREMKDEVPWYVAEERETAEKRTSMTSDV